MSWKVAPLGKLADVQLGKMLDQKKNQGEYRRYLGNDNVQWNEFKLDEVKEMRIKESERVRYGLRRGDLLICEGGDPGRCALWMSDEEMYYQKALNRVRVCDDIDPRYLLYYFLHIGATREVAQYYTGGATIKHLPNAALKRVEIRYPELIVQRRIASMLMAYDNLIENNRRQIALLEEAAQRLYKEWFVDLRFPGNENATIVHGLPYGWSIVNVNQLFEYHDSKRIPLSGAEREKMQGIYPYYGAATCLDYINNYLFDGVYLLLGEDGTVITSAGTPMLQYVWGQFWVNNHAHILTGREPFTTEYLFCMFSNMHIGDVVTGAAQPKISQKRLNTKTTMLPEYVLVEQFCKAIAPAFDRIRSLQEQANAAREARDRLLPKLMSGEIEV